jgi:hypothetical protein
MTCSSQLSLPFESTAILTVTLVDELEAPINGADVTVTLLHQDGTEVVGQTWPISMNYVSASDGQYTAEFEDDLEVEVNEVLRMAGVAISLAGKVKTFKRDIVVVED